MNKSFILPALHLVLFFYFKCSTLCDFVTPFTLNVMKCLPALLLFSLYSSNDNIFGAIFY